MKKTFAGLLAALSVLISCSSNETTTVVTPNARQLAWADAEMGVLIHFDMPVYQPDYNFRNWGTHPDASVFNPTELNTDQWLETAHKLGAKYAVLVAKHCSGFSLHKRMTTSSNNLPGKTVKEISLPISSLPVKNIISNRAFMPVQRQTVICM